MSLFRVFGEGWGRRSNIFWGVGVVGGEGFWGWVEEGFDAVDVGGHYHGLDVERGPAVGGDTDELM